MVGLRAVSMSGISTRPLGMDDCGREYWKLPTSSDLFVCSGTPHRADREEFRRLVSPSAPLPAHSSGEVKRWKRVSGSEAIRRVSELLGSSEQERELRANIGLLLLTDRKDGAAVSSTERSGVDGAPASPVVAADALLTGSKSQASLDLGADSGRKKQSVIPADSVPVALKLLPSKGHEILSRYVVETESVFEESLQQQGDGEEEGGPLYFTFSTSRK